MSRGALVVAFTAVFAVACATAGTPDPPGGADASVGPGEPDAGTGCPLTDPDTDADGVCDSADVCQGSDDGVDTDSDTVPDGCDVCAGSNDGVDTDSDSVPDGCDICSGFDDAMDTDADGVPDGCDECPGFDDNVDENMNNIPDGCEETLVDLTPLTGSLIETNPPYWASKGYLLTASQNIDVIALEWWINLPSSATIAARIYNSAGTLVASGAATPGQNSEQWYRSTIAYSLVAGQTYTISMYHSSSMAGAFDRRDELTQGFAVSPYVTNVNSRSNCATTQADVFPDCVNSWAPYMRMAVVP